jgi:hypothetical protein
VAGVTGPRDRVLWQVRTDKSDLYERARTLRARFEAGAG